MKALIFDLDGVVADTAAAHLQSWQRLADEEGFVFDAAARQAVLGRTREDSLRLIVGYIEPERAADWLSRKQRYFLDALATMGPEDVLPGVVGLLNEARTSGLGTALASSSRNACAVIDRLGVAELFDVVADGTTVAHPKPAPDIFLWVARQLKCQPFECLVFEDAQAGVDAALAGGFPVVALGLDAPAANFRLASLTDAMLGNFVTAA